MAPSQDKEKHSLNTDQTKLLCEVITKANVALTPAQWNEIAESLGISNGKAAYDCYPFFYPTVCLFMELSLTNQPHVSRKERYRYMFNSLSGLPTRTAKSEDGAKDPSTPKSAVKKAKTPSTPASTKTKVIKQSAKKRKLNDDEEDTAMTEKIHDASDLEDDTPPTKIPKPKKAKDLGTPFQTPKKAKPEENDAVNGEEVDSDSAKVASSIHSGTTATETPKPKAEPRDLETLFEEEGFGAIGGGEGSMFPESEDVI